MLSIKNLENAYSTLLECHNDYQGNQESPFITYIADSCVKRFEYTLETAWKLAKKVFIKKYGKTEQELTINNIFRFMQGYGYAENWERWREYYQRRNDTAHEYNIIKSRDLLEIIPDFLIDTEFFIKKLQEENYAD